MTTELTIRGLVPGMNELIKMHHTVKTAIRNRYQLEMRAQTQNRHTGRVVVYLWRNSSGKAMDHDNLLSTAKLILDSARRAGIIREDDPSIVTDIIAQHVKISRKVPPFTVVRIVDVE